jgi:nucleotidyltransferase/DNA polymerase involved in DNA repair
VVNVDLLSKSRSVTLEQPARDKEVIKRNVRLLFEKYLAESSLDIRRVGVRISGFSKEQSQQKQLSYFFG